MAMAEAGWGVYKTMLKNYDARGCKDYLVRARGNKKGERIVCGGNRCIMVAMVVCRATTRQKHPTEIKSSLLVRIASQPMKHL